MNNKNNLAEVSAQIKSDCCAKTRCCAPVETIKYDQPKVGRNDPCPCGNGIKFKKCCGKK